MRKAKNHLAILLSVALTCSLCLAASAAPVSSGSCVDDIFVTPEMVERDKEVVAEMIRQGEIIARTRASKMLSVTLLYQNPGPSDVGDWKDTLFPCGHYTYGEVGCAMTCYAMTARYYGKTALNTPPKFTTSYYNTYNRDPCRQIVSEAADLMGKTARGAASLTQQNVINFCIASINQNRPVVVRTDKGGSHYVLAYGYNGETILIRDPERGYRRTTLQQYFADSSIDEVASIG